MCVCVWLCVGIAAEREAEGEFDACLMWDSPQDLKDVASQLLHVTVLSQGAHP
jgi:hypothetical protein